MNFTSRLGYIILAILFTVSTFLSFFLNSVKSRLISDTIISRYPFYSFVGLFVLAIGYWLLALGILRATRLSNLSLIFVFIYPLILTGAVLSSGFGLFGNIDNNIGDAIRFAMVFLFLLPLGIGSFLILGIISSIINTIKK